jgi:hypothetical protein
VLDRIGLRSRHRHLPVSTRAKLVAALAIAAAALAIGGLVLRSREPVPKPAPSRTLAEPALPAPPQPARIAAPKPCCPSGRECGRRGCDAPLPRDERFRVRAERREAPMDASAAPVLRLCSSATVDRPKQCALATEGLDVTIAALQDGELALELALPVATETGVFRKPMVFSESIQAPGLRARAICTGIVPRWTKVPVSDLTLFLDPPAEPRPARCIR